VNVSDFDFSLPAALIAQTPAPRGTSRLLVLDRRTGERTHALVGDLPRWLRAGDVLVVNDTRVFPARLLGRRLPGGGRIEVLLLERVAPDRFEALVHPGQRLKVGSRFVLGGEASAGAEAPEIHGEIVGRGGFGRRTVRLEATVGSLDDAIDRIGHVPLPPYIARPDQAADRERYQTVYARERGSVAAPTAGLHFTPELLQALEARGVERRAVTLHVGYGTFKPVRGDEVEAHTVDPERYHIDEATAAGLQLARAEGRRIVAVGTTTVRALESAGRGGTIRAGAGVADLFIYPGGHRIACVDALLTNFHVPRSSLLMLVCAFAGRELVLRAYDEAVAAGYRFYSYGDAMLIV
jgi:S-adenosylmethionine:tRNA ribosyltransferase-isomerase